MEIAIDFSDSINSRYDRRTKDCSEVLDRAFLTCVASTTRSLNPAVRFCKRDLFINAAIELHDSKVKFIIQNNGSIVVELAAYVHHSDGRPGIDPGTGWTQPVRLTFLNATVRSTLVKFPDTILDGLLTLSAAQFENCFEVPSTHAGLTSLHLEFANDVKVTIRGGGFQAECLGMPTFVEQFDP